MMETDYGYPLLFPLALICVVGAIVWIISRNAGVPADVQAKSEWYNQIPQGTLYRPAREDLERENQRPIVPVAAGHYSQNPHLPRPMQKAAYILDPQTGTFFPMFSAELPPAPVKFSPGRADSYQLAG